MKPDNVFMWIFALFRFTLVIRFEEKSVGFMIFIVSFWEPKGNSMSSFMSRMSRSPSLLSLPFVVLFIYMKLVTKLLVQGGGSEGLTRWEGHILLPRQLIRYHQLAFKSTKRDERRDRRAIFQMWRMAD